VTNPSCLNRGSVVRSVTMKHAVFPGAKGGVAIVTSQRRPPFDTLEQPTQSESPSPCCELSARFRVFVASATKYCVCSSMRLSSQSLFDPWTRRPSRVPNVLTLSSHVLHSTARQPVERRLSVRCLGMLPSWPRRSRHQSSGLHLELLVEGG
jgi:hypothetical protein